MKYLLYIKVNMSASAARIYGAYFHTGNNPYSSVGSISTLRGIDPMLIGSGRPQELKRNWEEGAFQPYFAAQGVGGQSKVIRDTVYDPELNEQLRLRINRPLNAPALSRFYGTTPAVKRQDLENPEFATDNQANMRPVREQPVPMDVEMSDVFEEQQQQLLNKDGFPMIFSPRQQRKLKSKALVRTSEDVAVERKTRKKLKSKPIAEISDRPDPPSGKRQRTKELSQARKRKLEELAAIRKKQKTG